MLKDYKLRVIINGGMEDFKINELEKLLKYIEKEWNGETFLCSIRKMLKNGGCPFNE